MKKQYLIGLLGIAAISIPTGSSLLTNKHDISPMPVAESETGLTLGEKSTISFNDVDGDGTVNNEDTLNSASFKIDYDENVEASKDADKDGLALYSASTDAQDTKNDTSVASKTYNEINVLIEADTDGNIFNHKNNSLNVTIDEDVVSNNNKLNKYKIQNDEVYFYATASYQESSKAIAKGPEEVIGTFEAISVPVIEATETAVTAGEVTMLTTTQGEISYNIVLGHDAEGTVLAQTVSSVKWMDGETELASSEDEELSGTLTSAEDAFIEGDTYADTTIEVVMNDGKTDMDPITEGVEPFDAIMAPDKMGAGAVIGIIIAVLLVVGIIAYGGYYLYKKNVASKD